MQFTKKTLLSWAEPTYLLTDENVALIQGYIFMAINNSETDGINYGNNLIGIRHWSSESSAQQWINFQLGNFGPTGTIAQDQLTNWEIQDV